MDYIGPVIIGLLIVANIFIVIRVIKTGKFGTITLFEKDANSTAAAAPFVVLQTIKKLLDHTPAGEDGGFVIFGVKPCQYVQYALMPNGLLLNWPTIMEGGPEHLPIFVAYLNEIGFVKVDPLEDTTEMPPKHYYTCEDGLYAQCGRDALELERITMDLLSRSFGVTDQRKLSITLELDG